MGEDPWECLSEGVCESPGSSYVQVLCASHLRIAFFMFLSLHPLTHYVVLCILHVGIRLHLLSSSSLFKIGIDHLAIVHWL